MDRFEQILNAEIAALKKSRRYACDHCNDPRCACEVDFSRSDLRVAIFNDIRSAVLQPESFRETAVWSILDGIFNLRNANGGRCVKCSNRWFNQNPPKEEKEFMQYYLPRFAEIFISMPTINTRLNERKMLSGLVLFRTAFLPLFRDSMGDDNLFRNLILRVLHWENVIRRDLSGRQVENRELFRCFICVHLSYDLKKTHTWWNEKFIDSEDLNIVEEYLLTD